MAFCRYVNVLPFDQNRVKLLGSQNDYINASLIESKEGETPAWKYIATQVCVRFESQGPVSLLDTVCKALELHDL